MERPTGSNDSPREAVTVLLETVKFSPSFDEDLAKKNQTNEIKNRRYQSVSTSLRQGTARQLACSVRPKSMLRLHRTE